MTKCNQCDKGITKRMPGLECSSCGKVVHANQSCSGLAAKELVTLRNADCIDWNCEECRHDSSRRKSSFIIPDEVEDEEEACDVTGSCLMDTKIFLKDITTEMTKILKKMLQPIQISLEACCVKIDKLAETVESHTKDIKYLDTQYCKLKKEQEYLQTEIKYLKQNVRRIEQQSLENILEVSGLPKLRDENLQEISCKLASVLNVDETGVSCVTRLNKHNRHDSILQIRLKQAQQAEQWLRAARKKQVLVENIINGSSSTLAKSQVTLRRALTKSNKSLLWQAQQKLKPFYKYVWFQYGKVLARKDDNAKPLVVRSEDDVNNLAM